MTTSIAPAKKALLKKFNGDMLRAKSLKRRLIQNGYYQTPAAAHKRLPNHDKRDIAEFIFFEAASQFEHFALNVFILAARSKFNVQPKRATFIIGGIDRGLQGVFGWAAPAHLKKRANALFGASHFLSKLDKKLPAGAWAALTHAHKLRNRVAHDGAQSSKALTDTFNYLSIPAASRRGMSVGRALLDYKAPNPVDRYMFEAIIVSYRAFSRLVAKELK